MKPNLKQVVVGLAIAFAAIMIYNKVPAVARALGAPQA